MWSRRKILNVYNRIPYWCKEHFSHIFRIIPHKYLLGRDYISTLKLLRETEFQPVRKLVDFQNSELREVLLHSYRSTIYCKRKMDEKGISDKDILRSPLEVLRELEFTDKNLIRDNFREFLSDTRDSVAYDYCSTGGTSGEPFYFYIDSNRSARERAFFVDMWSRIGYKPTCKRVSFRGHRIRRKGWQDDWIRRDRKFSSFKLTDEYLESMWPKLCEFEPEFIYAYPSTAITLCQYIERYNKTIPGRLKALLLGSENIYNGQREFIEEVTGKRAFLWYGHSEKLVLAGECEYTSHYHAYPQYGFIEFINSSGEAAKPGEFAEIVGTGFVNTVMPFIRYRTGDYCTYLGDSCPECGRNYPIFSDVKGRWTQEFLYGVKGNSICMSAINVHSNTMVNVFRFQFFQSKPGEAILRLLPRKGFTEGDRIRIENEFNGKLDDSVKVSAVVVDDIPLTERGKFKFIDQHINLNNN